MACSWIHPIQRLGDFSQPRRADKLGFSQSLLEERQKHLVHPKVKLLPLSAVVLNLQYRVLWRIHSVNLCISLQNNQRCTLHDPLTDDSLSANHISRCWADGEFKFLQRCP